MNLKTKLIGAFLVIALLMAVMGLINIWITGQVVTDFQKVTDETSPQLILLGEIKASGIGVVLAAYEVSLLQGDQLAIMDQSEAKYQQHRLEVDTLLADYAALDSSAAGQGLIEELTAIADEILTRTEALIALAEAGVNAGAATSAPQLVSELDELEFAFVNQIDAAIAARATALTERNVAADQSARLASTSSITATLVAIVLAVLIGFLIARYIVTAIDRLKNAALAVGEGRLDTRVDINTGDEIGVLARAFNQMVADLDTTTVSKGYVDNILRSMSGALIVLNPDSTIARVNPAALQLLGYERQELIGKAFTEILGDASYKQTLDTLAPEGRASDVELVYRAKDGREIPVSFSGSLMQVNNGAPGVVSVALDITERKQAEAEREHLIEQLETANAHKSQFMATVSHELRTPLNAIIGQSGVMLAGMAGDLSDRQNHKLNSVYSSAKHLLNLINDILDIERISAGRLRVEKGAINVQAMLALVQEQSTLKASDKAIQFVARLSPELPDQVLGDQKHITQIATNLIDNAIKFTDNGQVELDVAWQEDALAITVVDTGPGIPANELDMIFEEFHRTESAQVSKEGTGLGLSIVRKLVQAMDGSINVTSKLGVGSTFMVRLPLFALVPEVSEAGD